MCSTQVFLLKVTGKTLRTRGLRSIVQRGRDVRARLLDGFRIQELDELGAAFIARGDGSEGGVDGVCGARK